MATTPPSPPAPGRAPRTRARPRPWVALWRQTLAGITAFKYRAFLSYSHRDAAWGKWLHAALERYAVDKELVGRKTPAGPIPKTLRPIFRDREDFAAGPSLPDQTIVALEASQF